MSHETNGASGRPIRVLLHMANRGGDWTGKATDFAARQEFRFRSISDLVRWLNEAHANSTATESANEVSTSRHGEEMK